MILAGWKLITRLVEADQLLVDAEDLALLGFDRGDVFLLEGRFLVGVPFVDFRRTAQCAKTGDLRFPHAAGHDRDQLVADEARFVFVAFDHLAADQFTRDDLEQAHADAGVALAEQVRHGVGRHETGIGSQTRPSQARQSRQNPAGFGQFMIGEVIRRELLLIQQLDHLVVEAGRAVGFDQGLEGASGHGVYFGWG